MKCKYCKRKWPKLPQNEKYIYMYNVEYCCCIDCHNKGEDYNG